MECLLPVAAPPSSPIQYSIDVIVLFLGVGGIMVENPGLVPPSPIRYSDNVLQVLTEVFSEAYLDTLGSTMSILLTATPVVKEAS